MPVKKSKLPVTVELLPMLPWHVSFLLGEAMIVVCQWILPAWRSTNVVLEPAAETLSGIAWSLAGIFLLWGVLVLAVRKKPWSASWRQPLIKI